MRCALGVRTSLFTTFQYFTQTASIAARSFSSCADNVPPETVGSPADEELDGFVGELGVALVEPAGVDVVTVDGATVGGVIDTDGVTVGDGANDVEGPMDPDEGDPEADGPADVGPAGPGYEDDEGTEFAGIE